jgi:hypothetical protein
MVFLGIPKVRIFIPLTLYWVLLVGLSGCTTLRGGLLTEADLSVSSSHGLESVPFDTIQKMNLSAKMLTFEGSIFVSTPSGTDRSRVKVKLSKDESQFELQGRMGLGKMDLQCGIQTELTINPPQDLNSKEEKMLDVLCRSIYSLSILSAQYEWSIVKHEQPELWAAKTQMDVEGESFLWSLERFNQKEGLILPQKITLEHASEPFRVQMLLKALTTEMMTTQFPSE